MIDPESAEVQNQGHIYGLPELPLPSTSHLKHRYDPVVHQVTNLLMQDGKLSKAQRVRPSVPLFITKPARLANHTTLNRIADTKQSLEHGYDTRTSTNGCPTYRRPSTPLNTWRSSHQPPSPQPRTLPHTCHRFSGASSPNKIAKRRGRRWCSVADTDTSRPTAAATDGRDVDPRRCD